ncbi:hypothetical protein IB239_09145 [Pseudomonas sp. PDM12]|uniref:DUF6988 family protein n=1 Tax=Pseudomonas sp. PDM12 TaxID=2769260 RepID=UPI0017877295|nr:hypothetical protein [Pseudomonas sp. PDM12]MBD9654972.1 hypothetical protein [Pseudomonas sp. PDM12]
MVDPELSSLIQRSCDLHEAFDKILSGTDIYDSERAEASMGLCLLSMHHAESILGLALGRSGISAMCLMRPQFEALVRAMWVWECATDNQAQKLELLLNKDPLQAAKSLPGISEMMRALEGNSRVHPRAKEMIDGLKNSLLTEMNSFVHAGVMPYTLIKTGVPQMVLIKTIKNSNAISTMTAMMMTQLTGDSTVMKSMSKIQPAFADCLPPLIKPNN